MKNYIVKALKGFDDYEGLEIKPENPHIRRIINATFNCTKERYEHLKSKGLVQLMGIEKTEEPKELKATVKKTKKSKKK